MKKFNLFAILFAIVSVLFFAGCDNDNDKKDGDANPPVEECFCDEAKTVACPDGGKDACEKPAVCDPACADDRECKCEAGKCECVEKSTEPVCDPVCKEDEECKAVVDGKTECKPKEVACVCDPACKTDEDCVKGETDKCECRTKDAQKEECFCDDEKKVACPEGGKEACLPQPPANEDKCKDKKAGEECETGKVCTAADGEKLECKDKPAEVEPKCEPKCKEDEGCVCEGSKCECKAKDKPDEECFCDEAKSVKCPDGDKAKCEAKPEEKKCEKECKETEECVCESDKCECKEKSDKPTQPDKAE